MRYILIIFIFSIFSFANELHKINLHLKWKNQFQFAGFYMAIEKGFYKKHGLDVNIKEAFYNQNTIQLILNDDNSFGIADSSLFYEKMLGKKIKILGAVFKNTPFIFVYLKSSGIRGPKDFKNKKLMLDLNMRENVIVKAIISKYNLKEEDINYIPTSYDLNDLISGKVDIFTAYSTNELYTLEKKGIDFGYVEPKEYDLDFYGDLIFTSEKNFKENPQRVKAFYEASIEGWKYAFKNINETIKVIQEKYNSQNFDYEKLFYEAHKLRILSGVEEEGYGKIKLSRINEILSAYFLSESKFDIENIDDLGIFSIIDDERKNSTKLIKKEKIYLNQKKYLTYCFRDDYYPYSIFKNNTHKGIVSDYIKELEKKLDIEFRAIKTKSWAECYNLIKDDKIDIASLILKEPNNLKYMTPTNGYLKDYFVLATKINKPFLGTMEDLKDQVIGIAKYPNNFIKLIKTKYPNVNLKELANWREGLKQVSNGEIYGYMGPSNIVSFGIHDQYPFEIKIMNRLDNSLHVGSMGVRNGNDTLLSILNKAINSIDEEKRREIKNNWVSVKQEARVDYTLIWQVLVVFMFLFLAFIYKQYVLKKANIKLERLVKEEVEKNREKDKILFQQAKLVSMGEMLNNIAHQWRQPLNAINSSVAVIDSLLMKKKIVDNNLEKNLSEIESQTSYMSDTIESFRMFFNPLKSKQDFALSEAVDDVLRIVKFDYEKNGIRIKVFTQNDTTVSGYLGEYIQIIISILNNSRDAFIINNISKPVISIYIDEMLIIDDNAGGINNDIIDRVFEPYFTTKHKEKGTGTGLYMAKMIVEHSMHGSLTLQQIKNGTRFKIMV